MWGSIVGVWVAVKMRREAYEHSAQELEERECATRWVWLLTPCADWRILLGSGWRSGIAECLGAVRDRSRASLRHYPDIPALHHSTVPPPVIEADA